MSEHIQKTIADLESQLAPLEAKVNDLKSAINQLCRVCSVPDRYQMASTSAPTAIRSDQFYGQPLATAVREVLTMRLAKNLGAATVAEIYDALVAGGFAFDAKNEDYAKRGLRSSLTKNTIFHRTPSGSYGLTSWYPAAKAKKAKGEDTPGEEEDAADDAAEVAEVSGEHPEGRVSQE